MSEGVRAGVFLQEAWANYRQLIDFNQSAPCTFVLDMQCVCDTHLSMKLADYLSANSISDGDFAEKIGIDRSSVSRLRRGVTRPDWPTIERIVSETAGAVTANDFLPAPQSDEAA